MRLLKFKIVKILFYAFIGVLFGVVADFLNSYVADFLYPDYGVELFFAMIAIWLLIISAIVFYHKRLSPKKNSAKHLLFLFFILAIHSSFGMIIHNWSIQSLKKEKREFYLKNRFSDVNAKSISFENIYKRDPELEEYFSSSFFLRFFFIPLFFLSSFIPLTLIKPKKDLSYAAQE